MATPSRALVLCLLAACSGDTGTIRVSLATAPGSTLLDGVQTLRMTITNPREVVTAERTSSGFELGLDFEASAEERAIAVDGLDAGDQLIATGASPAFAFGGVNGKIVIYMAAPNSMDIAPTVLEPARSELAVGLLPYGAIFASGRLEGGGASDAVAIYNAYDHTLTPGMPLPGPRSGMALAVGALGVYMFGGRDATGNTTASLWRFDTTVPPSGMYLDYGDKAGFARAEERLVPLGNERFLVTGTPAAQLTALDGTLTALESIASLPPDGASVIASDGMVTAILVGGTEVVRCRSATCAGTGLPGRVGATAVALPAGKVGIVCGSAAALRIDAATATAETFPGVPATPRTDCAVATTSRHLVIAGGTLDGGGVASTVEVFDVTTLESVAIGTLGVPRTAAAAIGLPNGQVLVAGGLDATGLPVSTLELFTPASSL